MLERLRAALHRTVPGAGEGSHHDEHAAVVELMVVALLADGQIDDAELEALHRFDESHPEWTDAGFAIQQYLGQAMANVRRALGDADGQDRLLSDISARLVSPAIRSEALAACEQMMAADREHPASETTTLERVRAKLA